MANKARQTKTMEKLSEGFLDEALMREIGIAAFLSENAGLDLTFGGKQKGNQDGKS